LAVASADIISPLVRARNDSLPAEVEERQLLPLPCPQAPALRGDNMQPWRLRSQKPKSSDESPHSRNAALAFAVPALTAWPRSEKHLLLAQCGAIRRPKCCPCRLAPRGVVYAAPAFLSLGVRTVQERHRVCCRVHGLLC
jgi:hypothetical protein